uniref:Major facilitator superfamily (MFS) profile domain-containing protein n=1 Tax=Strigamia maritima TaxID=126957 RepID=T1J7T9_STRMM
MGDIIVLENEKRFNIRLLFAIVTIAVGSGFQYGYNIGVVNAPQKVMEDFINYTEGNRTKGSNFTESQVRAIWSSAVAIYAVGGMIGGLTTSIFAEKFGRKKGLMIVNTFSIVGGFILGFSKVLKSYEVIILGRLVIGYSSGLHVALAPLFLVEIAPLKWRGSIGSTFQLVTTISILLSQIIGQPQVLGTSHLWPILFGLIIIPAVLQTSCLLFCPESPRFVLWKTQNVASTEKVLKWLRQKDDVTEELNLIKVEMDDASKIQKASYYGLIKDPVYRPLFYLSIMIMVSQQFSGINAIIYYSTQIFKDGGLSVEHALYATMVMGGVNVLVTILSMWFVERFGRRNLYLTDLFIEMIICVLITILLESSVSTSVCSTPVRIFCNCEKMSATTRKYELFRIILQKTVLNNFILLFQKTSDQKFAFAVGQVCFIVLYIIVFASGLGSIPLFVVHELFDQNTRSLASSFAIFVNWLCNFIVGLTFPTLANEMHGYVFLIFAFFLFLAFIYIGYKMPETKNKSPEEVRNAVIYGINMRTGLSNPSKNVLPVDARQE